MTKTKWPRLLSGIALVVLAAVSGFSIWRQAPVTSLPAVSSAQPSVGVLRDGDYILAVSWQPAFCETASGRPECGTQTKDRHDATHFSLHGLWPEPSDNIYCNVPTAIVAADRNGQWRDLPEPKLSAVTRAQLDRVMPGTQSLLQRHEWIKHGTCARTSEANYFQAASALIEVLNASSLRDLLARSVGKKLTAKELRAALDATFGVGAGQRMTLECERVSGRVLIGELRIALRGAPGPGVHLTDLIRNAPRRDPGCPSGEVDAVGIK